MRFLVKLDSSTNSTDLLGDLSLEESFGEQEEEEEAAGMANSVPNAEALGRMSAEELRQLVLEERDRRSAVPGDGSNRKRSQI